MTIGLALAVVMLLLVAVTRPSSPASGQIGSTIYQIGEVLEASKKEADEKAKQIADLLETSRKTIDLLKVAETRAAAIEKDGQSLRVEIQKLQKEVEAKSAKPRLEPVWHSPKSWYARWYYD